MDVHINYQDNIAVIAIHNPPLNALNKAMVERIGAVFDEIKDGTRVVVITGAGDRAFVAGADISQFPTLDDKSGMDLVRHGQRVYQKIEHFHLPVICAVNGFALGGGLELAMACDIRVASRNAKFGLPEATLGICPGYGGTQRLPRIVGKGFAKKMMYTGETISAQEAFDCGLCDVLTEEGEALSEAIKLAQKICRTAPKAVQAIKKLVNDGMETDQEAAIELEAQTFGKLCLTRDKNEGVNAFFEKRKPVFLGR